MNKDQIEKHAKQVEEEGRQLYKLEMASWLGTDIFYRAFKRTEDNGGYLSYVDGGMVKCIIVSKETTPSVIATISFDDTFKVQAVDLLKRALIPSEFTLFTLRSIALHKINTDPFFRTYPNTGLNLLPLESNGEKKLYVITVSKVVGVLIFGNDYLLTFNHENKLLKQKRIHQNIIIQDLNKDIAELPKGARIVAATHTHHPETGDLITATDICTLMVYGKLLGLERYYVGSENYISVWNCLTDELTIKHEGLKNKDIG